jgi:hypothetical protein
MLRGTRTSTKCLKSDGRVWRQREENEAGKKRSVNLSKAIQAGKGTTTLSGFQTTTVAPGQTYRRKLEGRKLRNFRLSILQSVRRILALGFGECEKRCNLTGKDSTVGRNEFVGKGRKYRVGKQKKKSGTRQRGHLNEKAEGCRLTMLLGTTSGTT